MTKYLLTTLLSFVLIILIAQDEKRPMTPDDVAKIQYIGGAALSDDANYIAYTVRVQADPRVENVPAHYELHVYNVATEDGAKFVSRGSARNLEFQPGNPNVTFLNRLDGAKRTRIYSIPLKGGEAQELLQFGTSISSYGWSPDGKMIAFVAAELKEEEKSDLPYSPEIYEEELTWSKFWLADPISGEIKPIDNKGNAETFAWSPDGSQLLVSASKTPLVDDYYMEQQLSIVDVASMKEIASIEHAGKMGSFVWSPDGKSVAFIAGADKNDPVAGRLFVASSKGGVPTQLATGWKGAFEDIEWLEANQIQFLASKGAESVVGKINPITGKMVETMEEDLAIHSVDYTSKGRMAMVAGSSKFPPELFFGTGPGDMKRLTHCNPWLSEISMGKQKVITYKAADGLEIEGILIYPVEYNASKRYPLLVSVHGGPEAHVDDDWVTGYSTPGQVAAGKGYAVFYPNYRGSTGRGLEFTLTSQGDAAGKEFDDIVNGVDHLIDMGLVDKNRVGVTGASYGGYATGWLATKYSDRFAGGVMFVGISNKVSKWGTTDIPNEEYLVHAREWVYNHYDFYLERSPIYYAGQCKTPLLIMHGKEDTRVHPSQSMEMYRHIKSRTNTPVKLVFYPGEGHGNARATARYDYNLRMLDWFDQHVKMKVMRP